MILHFLEDPNALCLGLARFYNGADGLQLRVGRGIPEHLASGTQSDLDQYISIRRQNIESLVIAHRDPSMD